ncbi:MAG: hypothetical protein AB7S26_35365 [Sandaracinaceae bacterium]
MSAKRFAFLLRATIALSAATSALGCKQQENEVCEYYTPSMGVAGQGDCADGLTCCVGTSTSERGYCVPIGMCITVIPDAGVGDAGDAGDADGSVSDGAVLDGATEDAGTDAGGTDAGTDAGGTDAGTDAGGTDAGTDAGGADAGVDAG